MFSIKTKEIKDKEMKDIKHEIEVIPADEPKELKLNWTVREYIGQTVYWMDNETPITDKDALKEGDQFIAGSWIFTARKDEYGELYGEDEHIICCLKFGEDDRNCWVGSGFINKRGIARAKKNVVIG